MEKKNPDIITDFKWKAENANIPPPQTILHSE